MIFVLGRYFNLIKVPGDGNCLFSALSKVIYEDFDHAATIRAEAVAFVSSNWQQYQLYTDKGGNVPYDNVEEYRNDMSKPDVYGCYAEIEAAAICLGTTVIVYELTASGEYMVAAVANRKGPHRPVYLHFTQEGVHYDALVPQFEEWFVPTEPNTSQPQSNEHHANNGGVGVSTPPIADITNHELDDDINDGGDDNDDDSDSEDEHVTCIGVSIGSSLRRQRPCGELPCTFKSAPAVSLSRFRYGTSFMWAGLFKDETTRDVQKVSIGEFNVQCPQEDCQALFYEAERLRNPGTAVPFWCCNKSTRAILSERGVFQDIREEEVRDLYFGTSPNAVHFQRYIRAYNHVLTTAIPIVKYNNVGQPGRKNIVTVNGKVTFSAPVRPQYEDGLPTTAGQLFFIDVAADTIARRAALSYGPELNPEIILTLENYLRRHNDFVKTFELAGRLEQRLRSNNEGDVSSRQVMLVVNPHDTGFRTTNRELIEEDEDAYRPEGSSVVAAVYVGTAPKYNYDIVMYPRQLDGQGTSNHSINVACPMLDTMSYPLIHLHAEDSFIAALPRAHLTPDYDYIATLRQYYSCRLMARAGHPAGQGVLFKCRALFQQWLCDAALKIMDSNLQYISTHQDELTACEYDSLQRFVASAAEQHGKKPGRIVVLPRGVQKSERRMYQNYMDAVRISTEFGGAAWFITFTTNPKWPEILTALELRGLHPDDYMHAPDIVVRAYLARVNILLHDIVNKSALGQVKGFVGVHEFTTTGLPHFHLAIILNDQDRPDSAEVVDAFVSAEIPDESDPELRDLVLRRMVHRPCDGSSDNYPNPPCRPDGGECRHGFPKPFSSETILTPSGPILRRRQTPPVYHRKFKCFIDNRWVVEYLIKGIKRYDSHVNAKACGRRMFWKYLFGYMEKSSTGHHVQGSMLTYALRTSENEEELNWDEVEQCRSMRMLGPFEAVFSILGQNLTVMSHSVSCLPVHLPRRQVVYYRGDATAAAALQENSKLLAWFKLNERDETARDLLYTDVIVHYRWVNNKWTPRKKKSSVLGRLMHVNPSARNLELFHLRLLLLNRPGMTGWLDLLTVDGVQHETFREACDALGVSSEEANVSYKDALNDVCRHGSPWQIRQFFSTLVAHCFLRNTAETWIDHRDQMSEDYRRRGKTRMQAWELARQEIIQCILQMVPEDTRRQDIVDMLPIPVDDVESEADLICSDDDDPDNQATSSEQQVNYVSLLNEEQRLVFNSVMESVHSSDESVAKVFRLTAPAGCGKTFLYKALAQAIKGTGGDCVCAAFTAIAASLLPDGETCHATFGIPVKSRISGTERSHIQRLSLAGDRLENASLILIDEISMLSKVHIEIIDHLLRMLTGKDNIVCGGKVVLLGGDMGQVLPVVEGIPPAVNDQYAICYWEHWRSCKSLTLSTNMRAISDPDFARWLTTVRDGSSNLQNTDVIAVPHDLIVRSPNGVNSSDEDHMELMADKVYQDYSSDSIANGVILAPTNDIVRKVNNIVLRKLPGNCKVFLSKTSLDNSDGPIREEGFQLAQEELDHITPARLPPHHLTLKKGAIVMLLLNLNKKLALCNGTRLEVVQIFKDVILVKRLTPFNGVCDEVFLPKVVMRSDDVPVAGSIKRHQFPITLAFCMTINKGQGQSFDRVGIFLKRPVFAHGQFFVAVSRARTRSGLFISVVDHWLQGRTATTARYRHTVTRNIVHRHLLL